MKRWIRPGKTMRALLLVLTVAAGIVGDACGQTVSISPTTFTYTPTATDVSAGWTATISATVTVTSSKSSWSLVLEPTTADWSPGSTYTGLYRVLNGASATIDQPSVAGSATVESALSRNQTRNWTIRFSIPAASPAGSYTRTLRIRYTDGTNTVYSQNMSITVTIPQPPPTFSVTGTGSLGTSGVAEFVAGFTPTATFTVSVTDAGGVGTTIGAIVNELTGCVGGCLGFPDTMYVSWNGTSWTKNDNVTRVTTTCTSSCTKTLYVKKDLHWAVDTVGTFSGPVAATLTVYFTQTSDGSSLGSYNGSITATIGQALYISSSGSTLAFGGVLPGYSPALFAPATSSAGNTPYYLKVSADQEYFTSGSGTHNASLPAGRLEVSLDGTSWTAISSSVPYTLATNGRKAPSTDFTARFRVNVLAGDPIDSYSLPFTISAIAQ